MQKVEWGDFKIEDVLDWQPQKEIDPLKLEDLKDETEMIYPFYGQATTNNGIISYNQLTNTVLNNEKGKPTILIHSNNQNIIYLETPFYLKDGHGATSVLQAKKLNKVNQMFFIGAIERVIKTKYSYNNKATKIELKNSIINLPVKNGNLDYEFMESFIAELETQRVLEMEIERNSQLEAHLFASGLKDYHLTNEEKQVLKDFESGKLISREYKLEDLFEIQNTLSFNKNSLTEGSQYDYITRTSLNQGVLRETGFVNRENINTSGNWSLGLLQMDFFYRKKDWYAGQFIRKVVPKFSLNGFTILYFSVIFNKQKKNLLTGLVRDVDDTFLNTKIHLPSLNNQLNFELIETFITAIQKLVIKDVVMFADKKIETTKSVIQK